MVREAGTRSMGLDMLALQQEARDIPERKAAPEPAVLSFELRPE